jgi:hypothetical protein
MTFRIAVLLLFSIISYSGSAQKLSCSCDSISLDLLQMDCGKKALRNNAFLYYQFNCDSIWLTLQNRNGKKIILYSFPTRLYEYHYRVGYVFLREFKNVILFGRDCVAPTGCSYVLINSYTGRIEKELGEPISCPGTETIKNIIFYLDYSSYKDMKLVLYYPDTKKKILLPLRKVDFTLEKPPIQFESIRIKNKILTVTYASTENYTNSQTMKFDLRKYGG